MTYPPFNHIFQVSNQLFTPIAFGYSLGTLATSTEYEAKKLVNICKNSIISGSFLGAAAVSVISPLIARHVASLPPEELTLGCAVAVIQTLATVFSFASEGAKWGLIYGSTKIIADRFFPPNVANTAHT